MFTHIVGWVPEHLKNLFKTIGQYWSLISDHGQTMEVGMGLHCPLPTRYVRADEVMFFLLSLTLMVSDGGWPCTDRAHHYGERPLSLPPQHSSFLELRVRFAEQ